jgi:hypothetical protein
MKTVKISDELHEKLRTYSFFNKITIQETIALVIDNFVESSKVVDTTNVKVVEGITTTNVLGDLDWTDKEAQDLIDPSILEKFNIS